MRAGTGRGWRALMAHQGSRARALLTEGFGLLALLDARSALCVRTLAGIYAGSCSTRSSGGDYDVFAGASRSLIAVSGKLRVIGSRARSREAA